MRMTWFLMSENDGGAEREVLEMEGGIREPGAKGEPWGRQKW